MSPCGVKVQKDIESHAEMGMAHRYKKKAVTHGPPPVDDGDDKKKCHMNDMDILGKLPERDTLCSSPSQERFKAHQ